MSSLSPTSSSADGITSKNKPINNVVNNSTNISIPDELEEIEDTTITSTGSLENNLIKTNRLLNHQVVTLKNKQQELVTLQHQLNKNLDQKNETIEELNSQLNKFLNDNEDVFNIVKQDMNNTLKKDEVDNQSIRSSFSTSMYSLKSLMNNDNESISSHQSYNAGTSSNKDPNKMIKILVHQRDVLKQKLNTIENQNLEKNKKIDTVQLENYKLKQRLDHLTKQQRRQSSVVSQSDLKTLSNIDLEEQVYTDDERNEDYIINSRKYSAFNSKHSPSGIHGYIQKHILKNKSRKGLFINYIIVLHLLLLLTPLFYFFMGNSTANQNLDNLLTSQNDLETINTNSNLPPSSGKVMHAPGKGNAEQAAKDPLL
ncbi:hypothetical protein HANVADRAFT_51190 [Hanseniaspora valbyensis NRRL Y-1626]|uniref:Protein CASP n=1 Tax=Hanseniaspora valbyensis NRRL Y-1626 TaxID=766949 RepID=A0A1B7TJ08_9ASCO|nr:hypothetical protein HANVADRAFT_51190 [Hanseniaspora valbyensis NRRL Y-1626]